MPLCPQGAWGLFFFFILLRTVTDGARVEMIGSSGGLSKQKQKEKSEREKSPLVFFTG
jgi:hypothetical protein